MIDQNSLSFVLIPGAPSLFKDLDFLPDTGLPAHFAPELLADSLYKRGIDEGVNFYFEEMYFPASDGEFIFVDTYYDWSEVKKSVVDNVESEQKESTCSLAWVTGFTYGWLCALSLTDRVLALRGLTLLTKLVEYAFRCSQLPAPSCVAAPHFYGSHGL